MARTKINRDDLGAGAARLVQKQDFSSQLLEDIEGKEVRYEGCNFSYSIIQDSYFHKATFVDCRFAGARFRSTVFRSATFEKCDFTYADFDRCVLPVPQILANLPTFPNVRWELLHNIRANARSIGDARNDSEIVWREIEAEMEHWRAIYKSHSSGYYAKYTRKDRLLARLRFWRLLAERYLWGHGESLVRLGLATFICLIVLSLWHAISSAQNLESTSIGSILSHWSECFAALTALYVDLPLSADTTTLLLESRPSAILAVALRYISIGLAVPILYKYIAKR